LTIKISKSNKTKPKIKPPQKKEKKKDSSSS